MSESGNRSRSRSPIQRHSEPLDFITETIKTVEDASEKMTQKQDVIVTEIKTLIHEVKYLMNYSAENRTRIENLEKSLKAKTDENTNLSQELNIHGRCDNCNGDLGR